MAAVAPVAVVIRRGPSGWCQLTLWNTAKDLFSEGAWLRGRIYPEKCDLSPDGELFVHAVFKGGGGLRAGYTSSWTAVSRPPWLEALALWPMGTTYGGGGRFVGRRRLILRGASAAHPDHPAHGLQIVEGEAPHHRSTDELEGAEWTGRDQAHRLVFTEEGRLFAWAQPKPRLLADFNGRAPDPKAAPAWAGQAIASEKRRPRERPRRPA